ncbi:MULTISPECIES: helix-turn-helix transcriptional regulator [unclassified Stygiolobus]|uniref:helix-turn-helix transcriptional regulator n=1 Tax=unclassified Stygiolobus TaxID=2824672 RepID=UPI00307F8852
MLTTDTSILLTQFNYVNAFNMGDSLPKIILYLVLPSYQGDILLSLAIIFFATLLVIRRVKAKSAVQIVSEKLDDRDLLVLEAIKRGYKTLTKISNFTGIPKTTTYRRLKKLTSLGYL